MGISHTQDLSVTRPPLGPGNLLLTQGHDHVPHNQLRFSLYSKARVPVRNLCNKIKQDQVVVRAVRSHFSECSAVIHLTLYVVEICTFAPLLSLVDFWLKMLNWRENQLNPIN